MNYKKIFVFILCVLLAVAAAVPFSGAFASEDNDAPPVDLPTGCRFHTRCPHAAPRCAQETPVMKDLGGGHRAACHLYD